jgi:hypothetical protein
VNLNRGETVRMCWRSRLVVLLPACSACTLPGVLRDRFQAAFISIKCLQDQAWLLQRNLWLTLDFFVKHEALR